MHLLSERDNYGQNCAYYNQIFTVLNMIDILPTNELNSENICEYCLPISDFLTINTIKISVQNFTKIQW